MSQNLNHPGATRDTSRRPYAAENTGPRYGLSAEDVAAYRADNLDAGNHYNVAKMRDDAPRDFRKVLPHEA